MMMEAPDRHLNSGSHRVAPRGIAAPVIVVVPVKLSRAVVVVIFVVFVVVSEF
jgi:hypothetical protein